MDQESNKPEITAEERALKLENFKTTLLELLQPIVENVVNNIRELERENPGKGKEDADRMLEMKIINQPMYDIMVDSLKDMTTDYVVKLDPSKYFNDPQNN